MIYLYEEEFKHTIDLFINEYDKENDKPYSYYLILDYSYNPDNLFTFFENNYINKFDPLINGTYFNDICFVPEKFKQIEFNNIDQGFVVTDEVLSDNYSDVINNYSDVISMGL